MFLRERGGKVEVRFAWPAPLQQPSEDNRPSIREVDEQQLFPVQPDKIGVEVHQVLDSEDPWVGGDRDRGMFQQSFGDRQVVGQQEGFVEVGFQVDVEDGLLCFKDNREELLIFEYLYYHLENESQSEVGG